VLKYYCLIWIHCVFTFSLYIITPPVPNYNSIELFNFNLKFDQTSFTLGILVLSMFGPNTCGGHGFHLVLLLGILGFNLND